MKITVRKRAAKGEDFLTTVARSIGSTLGTVARKVKASPRKSKRPKTKRKSHDKLSTASENHRRGIAKGSQRRSNQAAHMRRKGKKSPK